MVNDWDIDNKQPLSILVGGLINWETPGGILHGQLWGITNGNSWDDWLVFLTVGRLVGQFGWPPVSHGLFIN